MQPSHTRKAEQDLESQTIMGSFKRLPGELHLFGEKMEGRFAAELLTALGHPTRLRIINLLRKESMTVGQIAATLSVSQANVSQHLGVLLRAGALLRESHGAARRYSLRSPAIAQILELIEEFRQVHGEDLAAELVG